MILDPVERPGNAWPNRDSGGLPSRAGELARSQEGLKGRFCAPKSFAIGSTKWLFLLLLCVGLPLLAQPAATNGFQGIGLTEEGMTNPSLTTKLAVLAALSLLPFAIMLLTSFMKIVCVLSLLRNALGVQQTPPNQVLNGIALLITIYVMFPTGLRMYTASESVITTNPPKEMLSGEAAAFVVNVIDKAKEPLREFLEKNTTPKHAKQFYLLAYRIFPEPYKTSLQQNDFIVLIPSFITSQLKSAFEIGVLIYLPFFVIDLVVSNILLAMGMMMLSPLTIALPIKLLLLVMVDGWTVLIQGLAMTYR
ncbi:MAG: type III secretion system export apparatus subunit SctR [Verrucomicrobiota bacterium]|nr:type III secretion system export apparatus subunit SctR [Verrucomicrobiota bacterium]